MFQKIVDFIFKNKLIYPDKDNFENLNSSIFEAIDQNFKE